jgi:hypothetical protein
MEKVTREGARSGYDELPSVGSHADKTRYLEKKGYKHRKLRKRRVAKIKSAPGNKRLLAPSPEALNAVQRELESIFEREQGRLERNDTWQKISSEQRQQLARRFNLQKPPPITFATEGEINSTLRESSLANRRNLLETLPVRFQSALEAATRLLVPQVVPRVYLPLTTICNQKELEVWIRKLRNMVMEKLKRGPVIL